MPTITVSSGITNLFGVFSGALDDLFERGTVTSYSSTEVRVTTPGGTVIVTGTGFYTDGVGFYGNIDTVNFSLNSGETVDWTNVGLTIEDIQAAYDLENHATSPQIDAIENLLFPLDWTLNSNDNDDLLTSNTRTADNVRIHLTGDDMVNLYGGNDNFFASDGRDTINGGNGQDTIDGGRGNDKIIGGNGSDVLMGNKGRDLIKGGKGHDVLDGSLGRDNLSGGNNNDTITGGRDDDKLRGGNGADTFIFDSAVSSSDFDTIFDYQVGTDLMSIDAINPGGVSIFNVTGGAQIDYDGNSIYVHGATASQLNAEVGSTIDIF